MKTTSITQTTFLKVIWLFFAMLIITACNSDDDNDTPSEEMQDEQQMDNDDDSDDNADDDIISLMVPVTITVESLISDTTTELTVTYDGQNRLATITRRGIGTGDVSESTISYNSDGLITSFLEEEVEPSPFSREFQFAYDDDGILETLTTIVDGSTSNVLPVAYNSADNSYTITDGGEQVYVFDADNNLISCTAVGIPVLSLVHNSSGAGLLAELGTQVALGILLGGLDSTSAFGLYYFSTLEVSSLTFFDNEAELDTQRNAEGLITEVEIISGGEVTARSQITYQTIEL